MAKWHERPKIKEIVDEFLENNKDSTIDQLLLRADGRIEWLCEHGIGHTIYNPDNWGKYTFVHGCDDCCRNIVPYHKQGPK